MLLLEETSEQCVSFQWVVNQNENIKIFTVPKAALAS